MIRTESSGGWQNRDCSIALPYVCKKKPNATAERPPPGERGGGWGVVLIRVTGLQPQPAQPSSTRRLRSSQLFNSPARV